MAALRKAYTQIIRVCPGLGVGPRAVPAGSGVVGEGCG